MGFPDNYTDIPGARNTNRFQALGNSWAVPVVKWTGARISRGFDHRLNAPFDLLHDSDPDLIFSTVYNFGSGFVRPTNGRLLNTGPAPELCQFRPLSDILTADAPETLHITPVGCHGILRRSKARNLALNSRLRFYLEKISSEMPEEEIEKKVANPETRKIRTTAKTHLFCEQFSFVLGDRGGDLEGPPVIA